MILEKKFQSLQIEQVFLQLFIELVSGFKQKEQTAGPDSGTGRHRGQVPGKPDNGQGQIQGSPDLNLRPG